MLLLLHMYDYMLCHCVYVWCILHTYMMELHNTDVKATMPGQRRTGPAASS